ncbi:MAG: leucine-rich repeat domain-containing protein, partial [Muribaculaceae bacterium]|nr:leucine-rich repeat domain-containing protein [Muribaculaceae bacterium]
YTTSLIGVFRDCYALEEVPDKFIPENLLKRTNTLTNFFANCKSLKNLHPDFFKGLGEGVNSQGKPHAVTTLASMFDNCENLETLNLDFFNTPGGLQTTGMNYCFRNCAKLKVAPPVYKFTYNGETIDVPLWKRAELKQSTDADLAAAAKAVFGTSTSLSASNAFEGATNVPGWVNIPNTWGGGYCGYDKAPTLTLSAVPTEGAGYYSFDFTIKTTDAQEVSYYLASWQQIQTYLPRYNNSMEEMVTKNGIKIEDTYSAKYLSQCNTEEGLTMYYDGGMPEIKYGVIVLAKNPLGKVVKFIEVSTEKMPKGSDAFENFVGTWTVTSASTLIEEYDEDENAIDVGPTSFDITLEPERVDGSYFMTGWGYSIFRNTRPIRALFNKEKSQLEIWCGDTGGCQLQTNYPYHDDQSKFSQYTVTYYPYLENPNDHTVNYWNYGGATGECIVAGSYMPAANKAILTNQKSIYNSSSQVGDVYWVGMDVVLTMGSMSTSQTYTPLGIIEQDKKVTYNGKEYVPHAMGPYTLTRKSANVSAAAKKASAKMATPIQKQTYKAQVKKTVKAKK